MKLIGVLSDGRQMIGALPQELADLAEAAETIQRTLSTIGSRAAPETGPEPDRAEMPQQKAGTPAKKARKPRRAATVRVPAPSRTARPAGGGERLCEQCRQPLPADADPRRRFCKACVVERDRECSRQSVAAAYRRRKAAAAGTPAKSARLDAIRRADQHVVDSGIAAAVAEARESGALA